MQRSPLIIENLIELAGCKSKVICGLNTREISPKPPSPPCREALILQPRHAALQHGGCRHPVHDCRKSCGLTASSSRLHPE